MLCVSLLELQHQGLHQQEVSQVGGSCNPASYDIGEMVCYHVKGFEYKKVDKLIIAKIQILTNCKNVMLLKLQKKSKNIIMEFKS